MRVVIVTGMSGAGRSASLRVLEDAGFYCVDNCPASLVDALLTHLKTSQAKRSIALGIDRRSAQSMEEIEDAIGRVDSLGCRSEVLFLDCSDQVLVQRFSETRRPHLLSAQGDLLDAIRKERGELAALRSKANHLIDTTSMTVHELRRSLLDIVESNDKRPMHVKLTSFGFKYGIPTDANVVFDVRFLPNPYFDKNLKALSGLDKSVHDYVFSDPRTTKFWASFVPCIEEAMRGYVDEAKSYVTLAIGCTGGRHRSVALVEALRAILKERYQPTVVHRDIERS
jgi:UPF0042 nucleotide-binding protein